MQLEHALTSDGKLLSYDVSKLHYIDLDEDELCHWKYIKRVKLPNGKWRYYYDDESAKKDIDSGKNLAYNVQSKLAKKRTARDIKKLFKAKEKTEKAKKKRDALKKSGTATTLDYGKANAKVKKAENAETVAKAKASDSVAKEKNVKKQVKAYYEVKKEVVQKGLDWYNKRFSK